MQCHACAKRAAEVVGDMRRSGVPPRDLAVSETIKPQRHHVGAEALLPFAEGEGGRIVHVLSVKNGKKCGCICPECRGPLVAYHCRKKAPYFGHYTAAVCNPARAAETMLHRLAKQVIAERGEVALPAIVAHFGRSSEILHPGGVFRPEQVRLEVSVPGMRPDIVAVQGDRTLFVEVAVRHKCGADKIALIRERRQPTIEVDLQKWRHETDETVLEQAILYEAPRHWLFNATKHDTEEEARRRHEYFVEEKRQRAKKVAERVAASLAEPILAEPLPGSDWARIATTVTEASMAGEVDVAITGDGGFAVSRRLWQSAVLARLLADGGHGFSVMEVDLEQFSRQMVRAAVTVARRDDDVDWEMIEAETSGRVRNPYNVLRSYVAVLARRGIVQQVGSGQLTLTWSARQRANDARHELEAKRKRLHDLQEACAVTAASVGSPSVTLDDWLDTQHDGMQRTPRAMAEGVGYDFIGLLDRLRRIAALAKPDAAVVEDGLLGFPAEHLLAERKAEAARRAAEAEERRRQRRAAEEERNRQEAAAKLKEMRGALASLGPDGANILSAPIPGLGGRSIEDTQGWMTSAEESAAWHAIRWRQEQVARIRAIAAAAEERAAQWRERLERDAQGLLGEALAQAFLRSRYTQTDRAPVSAFCVDEVTYKICRDLLQKAAKARR